MKDVSVIIINYNTAKYTIDCIKSVLEHTNDSLTIELIVIDNNSEPEDYQLLKKRIVSFGNVQLHRSVINTGFGGGNMLGVQFANAKYLLFLNNDAFLLNDCLTILYQYMETHRDVGISSAQNYNENGEHVISFDHNKGIRKLIFGRSFLEKNFSKSHPKRKNIYNDPISVDFVNGAFMFFRTDVFASVGGFDTTIFLYFEEMDICHRINSLGFKTVLVPNAKIKHLQGASTGISKKISTEGMLSYLYVIKKNYSYLKYVFIRSYFFLSFLIKPKKWFLLPLVITGAHISKSLKQQQKIRF